MARPEVTGRKPGATDTGPPIERLVFSVDEFCAAHGISRWTYYEMRKDGTGPHEMRIGHRIFISVEAAAKWRKACERKAIQLVKAREARERRKDAAAAQA
jgi:hypothetical protein